MPGFKVKLEASTYLYQRTTAPHYKPEKYELHKYLKNICLFQYCLVFLVIVNIYQGAGKRQQPIFSPVSTLC